MAAGSHLENGIWALLVIAAIRIEIIIKFDIFLDHILVIIQWLLFKDHPIEIRIKASPIRLVRAVIIPALSDFGFL